MLRRVPVAALWCSICAWLAVSRASDDERITIAEVFGDDPEYLARYIAPFIELDGMDEERLLLLPGAPTPVRDAIGAIIGTKEILETVPKFKLIQCVDDGDCPSTFPFCGKVEREQLIDPSKWVEGMRACFQCTEEETSLCGGSTPVCNGGFCTECKTDVHCDGTAAPQNPVCSALGQCVQCTYMPPDTTPPFNFFETGSCTQSSRQVPTCGPGTEVTGTVTYGNFGNCVQCATADLDPEIVNNCGAKTPWCTDAQEDGPVTPICTQCHPDYVSQTCKSKSTKSCSATTQTCGGCENDEQCGDSQICVDGACTTCTDTNTSKCTGEATKCLAPNSATSSCVQCLENPDCSAPQGVCDLTTHTCTQCTIDDDCPSEPHQVCDAGQCVQCRVSATIPNPDCQARGAYDRDYCNPETKTCVPCLDNLTNQCGDGQYCKDFQCVTGCADDGGCTLFGDTPVCVDNQCRQCASNADCSSNPNGPICNSAGFCTNCLADGDCDSASVHPVCATTTDPVQGLLGECVSCTDDNQCSGDTPKCCNNQCRDCCSDSDCTSDENPVCGVSGYCLPCRIDADCAHTSSQNGVCANVDGVYICGSCNTDTDCQAGSACQQGQCVKTGCTSNADCGFPDPDHPYCDTTDNQCVQCLGSNDCTNPKTPVCATKSDGGSGQLAKTCTGCSSNTDCTGNPAGEFCDAETGACVGCLDNSSCAGNQNNPICCEGNVCCPCTATNFALCTATGGVCDVTAQSCRPCVIDADCPAGADVCVQGNCRECGNSADCADTHYCNPETNTCIPGCDGDAKCLALYAGERDVCNVDTHECVTCTNNDSGSLQCSDNPGTVCELSPTSPKFNQCVDCSPSTSGSCPVGKSCDPETYTCVACLNNNDCSTSAGGPYCNTDKNVCEPCSSTNACTNPNQVCKIDAVAGNTCVGCLDSDDCPTGACGPDNICTPCLADGTGCENPTPVCLTSGPVPKCVACGGDGDCAQPTPKCDTTSNTCKTCLNNSDCANTRNPVCLTGGALGNTCVQCSAAYPTCASGQVCDTTKNRCVTCRQDSDCASNPINTKCDQKTNTCVPECRSDSDCFGSRPVCDVLSQGGTGKCIQTPTQNAVIEQYKAGRLTCSSPRFAWFWQLATGRRPGGCQAQPNRCCHCPSCSNGGWGPCPFASCNPNVNPTRG